MTANRLMVGHVRLGRGCGVWLRGMCLGLFFRMR